MNLAIVGVGALGKRHLQSICDLKEQYSIYAVEINEEAIKALSTEMPWVHFVSSIDKLPEEIAAAVFATGSNVRRTLFEQLIAHSKVSNIIFEKVLFQKEEDYHFVKQKLDELNIKAWVNCARREWDAYKRLKEELKSYREMHFSMMGGNWGMGCNSIHMLDLVEFLSDDKVEKLDISGIENHIVESKRKGFYEFFGTITGASGRCKSFSISCMENSSLPSVIEITTESARYWINEGRGFLLKADEVSNWEWKEREFKPVFQSQMTGRVVKSILENGDCNLAKYDDAMELHLKFIVPLIGFFNANGMEGEVCPIT